MALLPKVNGQDLPALRNWADRLIAFFERQVTLLPAVVIPPEFVTFEGNTLTVAPTVTQLPSGSAGLFKRTDTGVIALYYNDAGSIKKVTLT